MTLVTISYDVICHLGPVFSLDPGVQPRRVQTLIQQAPAPWVGLVVPTAVRGTNEAQVSSLESASHLQQKSYLGQWQYPPPR